jgi:leucyl-tRNA---protein transferase
MHEYLIYKEQKIADFLTANVAAQYAKGYLFGRREKGDMYQTRSLRVNLEQFELSSENRRVLKKFPELKIELVTLPYPNYTWEIHQLGKTFYAEKFGDGTMSASKIKAMFTQPQQNNMTHVVVVKIDMEIVGYALAYASEKILHYAYPFYKPQYMNTNLGIAMMTAVIDWCKQKNYEYVYLGSIADHKAKYKLQFSGLEWWDNESQVWSGEISQLKELIKPAEQVVA